MAEAEQAGEVKLRRCSSMSDIFRSFKMAELRAVLLGNSWIQRCLVGNLFLKHHGFDVKLDPQVSVESVTFRDKTLTVINTPDLLQSDLTEDRLTELVSEVAEASSPGPHVFLLVLEPENFTEQHQLRIQSILGKFSEQPFDHTIVLLSTHQQSPLPHPKLAEKPHLKSVIEESRHRYQWVEHFKDEEHKGFARAALLTRVVQIVTENSEDHLKYEEYTDTVPPSKITNLGNTLKGSATSLAETVKSLGFTAYPRKKISEEFHFQILSLKISGEKQKKPKIKFMSEETSQKDWRGKKLKIVKTANLFRMSVPEVIDEMKRCMREFRPGPNAVLLKPSAFTEREIGTLRFILSLFDPNAFKHSILLFTDEKNMEPCTKSLLQDCDERYHIMSTETFDELMMKVETMVADNKGSFVSLTEVTTPKKKFEKINLVFCGKKDSGKTLATKAILGPVTKPSSSSQCIKHQAEVHGRIVSIVELPAMSGKPEKEVMEEYLSSISMCDPEGVHAFVMVLAVAPLTDEDKTEFKAIQDTLGSRINNFTVILFTVESDPKAEAFTDFVKQHKDIQTLCQSCKGHVFLNIKDPQQASQVLNEIENIMDMSQRFTTETFAKIQIQKFAQTSSPATFFKRVEESEKTLRIVLIGKTGNGKSSSGNSILGKDVFKYKFGHKATTKLCQKEQTKIDGCPVDVVDTPGLFDKSMSNDEINDEMCRCISLLAPGPHVFLLVLGIGRFTEQDNETLNLIKKGFGKDAQKYTIVLFTHGDELDRNKISIEDFIKDNDVCDVSCQKLISDCGNRYHVFNNRDETKRQLQVKELIQKIDALVKENGGSCYTNEMLKEAEAAIQEEVKRILKEKEEEFKREKKEMEDKHKQEMQKMQQRMDKEREETDRVRREKDKELRAMDAKIKKGQELLKEEQEKRDKEEQKWKEQDRVKRQQYEQDLKKLEENLQQNFDLKSQESRDKMRQEREAWEAERTEWWQKRHNEDEKRQRDEFDRLIKLEQEYKDKMEQYRKEKEDDDQRRHEQERKARIELEEQHNRKIEDLTNKYETENTKARKQAEEFNEFKKRKETDFAALIDKHLEEVTRLKEEIKQKQGEYQSLQNLAAHNETTLKSDMENLQTEHKKQLIDLAIVALMEEKENNKKIKEVQKKNKQEIEACEQKISDTFVTERERKVEELKKKQSQEMEDLEKTTVKDDLPPKIKELSDIHKKQIKNLESEHKKQLKEQVDEIKKKHDDEMNAIIKDLLKKNEEHWGQKITELQKKQKDEMDKFMLEAGGKVNEVELDRLKLKHEIEMDKIKKRMLFKESWCPIF